MDDPVPAIAEAAAEGETAALFADIRAVLGVGVVNLIWRHLATIPGALPWAWGLLRPRYADGSLAAAAAAGLTGALAVPRLPPMPEAAFAAAGLSAEDRRGIAGVLAAYERTNPLALLALSALALRLEGVPPETPRAATAPPPPPAPDRSVLPLPPLLPAAALGPERAALIRALNRLGAGGEDPAVVATMYRHLAHWPAALALAWALLAPLDAEGRLAPAIAACREEARRRAARMPLPAPPPLPEAARAAVAAALDRFGAEVLPRMVVVCAVLRGAGWGDAGRAG